MSRLSRRSFLAASAAAGGRAGLRRAAPAPTPAPAPEVGRSGNVDVVIVGAGAAGIAAARRLAAAGKRFALVEAADQVGGRCITDTQDVRRAVRSRRPLDLHGRHQSGGEARAADRARPLSGAARPAHAHRPALRARRRDGGFSRRRSCAPTAPSRTPPAAAPTSPARRRCRRISANGGRRIEFVLGPYGAGKDLAEISAVDFSRGAERDNDAFCRQGFGALIAKLAAGRRAARDAGDADRMVEPHQRVGHDQPRPVRRARRHRHGVDQRAHLRQDQVRARAAQARSRCRRQAQARQPRSRGAGVHRQSARAAPRRADVREIGEQSHRRGVRQCLGLDALRDRRRRQVRPRAVRQGRGRDDRVRGRLARRALRHRHQERRQAQPRDPLEPRAVGAGRVLGGGARRAAVAQGADGAAQQPHVPRRRGRARDAVGHGRRRLGIGRARRRRGGARCSAATARRMGSVRRGIGQATRMSRQLYARNTPPVRLPTSATILPATASISSSVSVFSRGCNVTAIAIDFLPGSMPLPS